MRSEISVWTIFLRSMELNYEEIPEDQVIAYIIKRLKSDSDSKLLVREVFQQVLEYLPLDVIDQDSYTCDQCGDYNNYVKYGIKDLDLDSD